MKALTACARSRASHGLARRRSRVARPSAVTYLAGRGRVDHHRVAASAR